MAKIYDEGYMTKDVLDMIYNHPLIFVVLDQKSLKCFDYPT